MAGFLSGLFGGKKKREASAQPEVRPPRENGQAYYLDADDAKSYGNADYMRTAKKVRRTFPKTVNNAEIELEREISSMTMSNGKLGTQVPKVSIGSTVISSTANSSGSVNGSAPTDAEVAQRRKSDSSLDIFRSMAKDIRK